MQGDRPLRAQVGAAAVHRVVDRCAGHFEKHRLAAHEGLVVTFRVADRAFVGALVGESVQQPAHAPGLVGHVAQQVAPGLGHSHREPVVESDAAVAAGRGQSGHPRNVLSDRDRVRAHGVDHAVGESQICERVLVDVAVEVLRKVGEIDAKAVIAVDHGRDAVEAESVEMEFVEPVAAVGKEEMERLVAAVVEEASAPGRVASALAVMAVAPCRAIEKPDTLNLVGDGVRVHEIHDDRDA